jgi:hypothetical protein
VAKTNLLFAIDVSGIPPKNTITSCVCFDMHTSHQILNTFKKKFKKDINKKGRHLDNHKLGKILKFLDNNKIRSYSTQYNSPNWEYAISLVPPKKAYKIEKIFGIIYYILLEKNSKPRHSYIVHACQESFMDINTVISACRSIAKMRGMDYNITTGSDKFDDYIKIADYVAAATRKIKYNKLKSYKYHNLIKAYLPKEYIKKVFD